MSPHRALRATEGHGDLLLGGIPGVDQEDHRVRLGHRILGTVVVHGKSGYNDDAVLAFGLQGTASMDAADP